MIVRIRLSKNWPMPRRALVVDSNELVCLECQYRIAPDEKFCSHCHAVILRRYCQPCRKLVPDHTLFCPYCGASAKEKRKRRDLIYPTNVALILVLFLAMLFLWPDQKTDHKTTQEQTIQQSNAAISRRPGIQIGRERSNSESQKAISQNNSVKNPEAGVQLNLKGHSLIQQGRYYEAVSFLYQAIKSFPEGTNMIEYFFAQYNLGHSLRKIGKSEEAIPYLERCVAYDRENQMFQRELHAARRDLIHKENY